MYFGTTIRQIRQQKGFSQKEVYQDILSKSYAISFEQGNHSISADLLLQVLERLSIDMDEFLFIAQAYQLDEYSEYIYRYSHYANTHDLAGLRQLLAETAEEHGRFAQIRAAELICRIRILEHYEQTNLYDPTVAPAAAKKKILDHLFQVESWTLREVQLYANTVELLAETDQIQFFRRLSKSAELYVKYDRGREIFCSMLVNLISQALRVNKLNYAEVLISQLELMSTDYKELFHQVAVLFFRGVLLTKQGKKKVGSKAIQHSLAILRELNQAALASELESLIL